MKIAKLMIVTVVLCFCECCSAGTFTGMVQPYYYNDGMYLNLVSGQRSGAPACATRSLMRLQETDPSSPVFKQKFALIAASWIASRPVSLWGTNSCTTEGDEIVVVVFPNAP